MKRAWLLLGVLLVCLLTPSAGAARPMRVAFIEGIAPGEWEDNYLAAMQDAAHDLGIELIVQKTGHWPTETLARVRSLLEGPNRPDYLVITIHRAMGPRLLELAEQERIPVFVVNAGLLAQDRKRLGGPRQVLHHWIGQMLPDDEHAGYALANAVIDEALRLGRVGPDGKVQLVGLGGVPVDQATIERERGLQRAVAERSDVTLLQVVHADWDSAQAQRKMELLLRRYPQLSAIWSANDAMALGALAALHRQGLRPGVDVLVGATNWVSPTLDAVGHGELTANIGGHFLEGAWALVLLYDYHHGLDFAREAVDWRSEMYLLTRHNDGAGMRFLLDPHKWEHIDFRAYSKVATPGLAHYSFTFESLVERLARADARRHAP